MERNWRLARGTAILSMLWVHGFSWSLPRADYLHSLEQGWRLSYFYLLGVAGLALPGIAGKSFFRLRDKPLSEFLLFGWILLLCGFSLNWATWGIEQVWYWDGLYFLGVSVMLLGVLLKSFGKKAVLPAAIVILFLSELLQFRWETVSVARVFLGGHNPPVTWPVFPWFALFLLCFASEDLQLARRIPSWKLALLLVAGSFYEGGFVILRRLDVWEHNPFLMGSGLVVAVWCGILLVLQGFDRLQGRAGRVLEKILFPLSDGTFWIYLLHVPLGYPLATLTFSRLEPMVRIFVTPVILMLGSWVLGSLVGVLSRKRLRIVLTPVREESA